MIACINKPIVKCVICVFQTRSATNTAMNMEHSSKDMVNEVEHVEMLDASFDAYGGVIITIKNDMDENVFTALLQTSISQWKQQVIYMRDRNEVIGIFEFYFILIIISFNYLNVNFLIFYI
ncbi:putative pre-nudix hydrolase domain-containing protein [Helianthus anomalus]